MSHDHGHARPSDYNRAFAIGVALNVVFVLVEASYGFFAGSLALRFCRKYSTETKKF